MKTKAYCFDLDGTVTRDELLPLIAQEVDLYDEISALTEATIKGIIPFEKSFRLRCKLLSEIPVDKVSKIVETVRLYDPIVDFIKSKPKDCFIITGNLNIWVNNLIQQLGCNYFSSVAEVSEKGGFQVKSILDKGDAIKNLRKHYDFIISVGDGMGDVRMFENSDLSIAFGGTHAPIRSLIEVSDYVVFQEDALCQLLNTL